MPVGLFCFVRADESARGNTYGRSNSLRLELETTSARNRSSRWPADPAGGRPAHNERIRHLGRPSWPATADEKTSAGRLSAAINRSPPPGLAGRYQSEPELPQVALGCRPTIRSGGCARQTNKPSWFGPSSTNSYLDHHHWSARARSLARAPSRAGSPQDG